MTSAFPDVTTKLMLAITHVMLRRLPLFLAILTIVLGAACSPSGPKALMQGEQLIKKGDYPAAVKKLEIASKKLPSYPQVWNFLGLAYHGQGKNQEAIDSYQKALSLDRNFAVAYYNLGSLYFEMNRLPEALSALTSFTILQSNSESAWLKVAAIQLRLQKPDDADRSVAQALKINPNNPEAYNNLGLAALQRRKTKEALQLFDKALYIQADYAPAILNQAVILHGMPASKQVALQRYRAYISLEPNSKEAPFVRQTIAVLNTELNPPPVVQRTNPPPVFAVQTNTPATNAVLTGGSSLTQAASTQTVASIHQPISTNTPVVARNFPTNNVAVAPTTATNSTASGGTSVALSRTNVQTAAVSSGTHSNGAQPQTVQSNRTAKVATTPTFPVVKPDVTTNAPAIPKVVEETAPPTRLESVAVQDDPPVNPVQDIRSEQTVAGNTRSTTNQNTGSASSTVSTNRDIAISRIGNRDRDNKSGVLDKMNPTSWFRGNKSKSDEPRANATTANQQRTNQPNVAVAVATPVMRPAPPVEAKAAPHVPRYPFKRQMQLPEGDRAAAEISYNRAVTAHQEKRLAAAIESYMEAIKLSPSYFQAYYNLGLAAYQMQDLPLAMSAGEAAVFLRPGSVDARYNFALALRDANYYVDAANQLRELLVESPDDVRGHLTLANIYAQQLKQPSLASKHYLRVLELDTKHPQAPQIRYWLNRAN